MNYWVLITNVHEADIYILPEGDQYPYEIALNDGIKKGDTVYLWWNPYSLFYGWGEVAETPQPIRVERQGPDGRIETSKRMSVLVNRRGGFYPRLTGLEMRRDPNLRKFIPEGQDDLVALPLRPGQAFYINDYVKEHNQPAPVGSTSVSWLAANDAPEIVVQAIITPEPIVIANGEILTLGPKTTEGRLVSDVTVVWFELERLFRNDPEEIYNIDPRKLEEIVAGAYVRAGYEVELTPRSGDKGRDVVATKHGVGSIKIFDQVKRYRVSRPVSADEVRSLLGTITAAGNVSKGVITTTSMFAPRLLDDEAIRQLVPFRLELKDKDALLKWLKEVSKR